MIKDNKKVRGFRETEKRWLAIQRIAKKLKCKPSDVIRIAISNLINEFKND